MFSDARPLTGRAVLVITLMGFGTVVGANAALTWAALSSFPGLEVRNSYVASQSFDAEARAQAALGWTVRIARQADGGLTVNFADAAGAPVLPATVALSVGRPTEARDDRTLVLDRRGDGYHAGADLPPGRWRIWLTATAADGTPWRIAQTMLLGDGA
jgi:nitrogen fixation protein FixH